ncbi:MAG: adenylyl-sulfate kinase [Actinomycetia bacterium]|nr:adenylyl-sulfate kinase [Actinomycetes bacterium]
MSDQRDEPRTARYTLHGADLSWLHLILEAALPASYRLPGEPNPPFAPSLLARDVAVKSGSLLDLLDPEGVTLATVAVSAASDGWVAGSVSERSGFSIVDHQELRTGPAAAAASWRTDQVWALWAEAPVPLAVRAAARTAARAAGATIAEIVALPTGFETSRQANTPARLAAVAGTREDHDRVVVVPWPAGDTVPWDAEGVLLRAHVAAAYGATELLLVPGVGVLPDASPLPVRYLNVPQGHTAIPVDILDAWVTDGVPLPDWAAEPAVAAELQLVHRPRSRSGLTVLLSGLSGSGKSTVARALAVRLMAHESRSVSLLDGDVVRHHLSKGLGFSRPDRITNVLRIGFVAAEITKAGGVAVCCPIAPYDETRKQVRSMVEEHGMFVLVHIATPLEECERRDRKGLYAMARRGEIPEFTGISDSYDVPTDSDVVVDTTGRTIDACVDDVYDALVLVGAVN